MKLVHKTCETSKPRDKTYRLSDGQNLYLEIRPKGSKYWRYKYRYGGKEKLLALGVFPSVGLQEARLEREKARNMLSRNIDPAVHKKENHLKAISESENTFEKLALEWHEQWKQNKTEKHALAILSRLKTGVFPFIGALPLSSITPPMVLNIVRKTEARQAYDVARRIRQTCGQIFRYGVATGRTQRDITYDIRDASRPYKAEHFPALNISELPEFLKILEKNEMRLYKQTQLAMRMLMLTFTRTSELINSTWDEFNLDEGIWRIPAHRMKMRREHLVPLSKQALEIVQQLKEMNGHRVWLFPNQQNYKKPMSNATIAKAIQRMGYKGRMSGHGFRALATTTIIEKLGYRYEVIDRQLAHSARNKIRAAYDRAEFLEDRVKMMQKYADYIDSV